VAINPGISGIVIKGDQNVYHFTAGISTVNCWKESLFNN